MASETEPAKLLLPYLQRADELQKHEPLVAYYCRLYAMERGLKIPQSERTKTTNALLVSLMKQLEKDKKSLKLAPEDNLYLEGFASSVFAKADKQDRAGRADLGTAKTFYAASIFFEILNQFGEIQPDLEQKQKYAVWKAADIRKAMKEGRKPQPGPPAGDEDPLPSTTPIGSVDLGQSKINPNTHHDSEPGPSSHFHDDIDFHDDKLNTQHSMSFPPSSPSYPTSHDFHPPPPRSENSNHSPPPNMPEPYSPPPNRPDLYSPPPNRPEPYSPPPNRPEIPTYSPQYHQPPFPQEPQQHFPQNYSNFQSYPSFSESSLPTAPSHYPSYYQGSDAPSYTAPPPPATDYPSTEAHYNPRSRNGATVPDTPLPPTPAAAPIFEYDSNYQPPAEKIAEAHKAARFAVGALAFDDVPVAVDFLRKSLELLTRPSAGH